MSGVTSGRLLSLVPALTPSISVHLPPRLLSRSLSIPPVFLACSRRIDLSLRLSLVLDGHFFRRPSFSVSPRLPLFLVVIISLLLVISLRAIRSLGGRSSYGPIGCTQAYRRELFSVASYVNRARKPTFLRMFGLPLMRQVIVRKRDFFALFNNCNVVWSYLHVQSVVRDVRDTTRSL